jgi:hypothetical protein
MVDEIFNDGGKVPDELDLVKEDVGATAEINSQDFKGGSDMFIIRFFEILSVERIFKVEQDLVSRFDLAENQVEERGFPCSPHARDDDGFGRIVVGFDLIKDESGFNHRLLFYI